MSTERPQRRMTLRQLMTHSEKCTRDLIEHLHTILLARLVDFRDLSRPVRRRSKYPTLLALLNALHRVQESNSETQAYAEYLLDLLEGISEQARRERVTRQ